MEIICLQSSKENEIIENDANNFNEQYDCQEIFYPLWLLEVEVSMHLLYSRVKKARMKVAIDGLSGDVSFVCNEIKTYQVEVKPEQILPLAVKMDAERLEKAKDSLLPFVLSKARSIFVRPSIDIQNSSIIYKHLYRLSSKVEDRKIIYMDKSSGNTAVFKRGGKYQ